MRIMLISCNRPMFITESVDAFQHRFIQSLRNMLSPDQAGAFILVLANSMQDRSLRTGLENDTESVFRAIRRNMQNDQLVVTDDDRAVLQALEHAGTGLLTAWESRKKGGWELVLNPIRSLRPSRVSSEAFDSVKRPFDDKKFSFNKAFLRTEILWEGSWQNTHLRVLYNKFPFAPYHLIIVPDPDRRLPQYLTAEYHELIWQLLEHQQSTWPGLALGYNSLGACASVNQLHFQSFLREDLLPVEQRHWQHNGGHDPYPVACLSFDSMQACWQQLDEYHRSNQPYNLLYRPGRCYLLPRVPQGSNSVLPRVEGAGWLEMCGVFNVADRTELESVSAADLEDCLRSLSVSSA